MTNKKTALEEIRAESSYKTEVTFILVWVFLIRVLLGFLIWGVIHPLYMIFTADLVQKQDTTS